MSASKILEELANLSDFELERLIYHLGKDKKDFYDLDVLIKTKKEREIRKKAASSLLDFTLYTKEDYIVSWHHKLLADTLEEFIDFNSGLDRLIIQIGPRTGKSELVSRRLPAYIFGKTPDMPMIATTYGSELAQRINRDVQRIIDTDKYRELFPNTTLNKSNVKTSSLGSFIRTSSLFEIVNHKGSFRTAGVGEGITGMGGRIMIGDDLFKDWAESQSATRRQVIWDWYTSTFLTRLTPDGKVVIMMTRWHHDDVIGRIINNANKGKGKKWEIISLPMEFELDRDDVHPLDPRTDEGELLWPSYFPREKVDEIKHDVGSRVFISLYQQRPSPDGGVIFKRDWLRYYRELPEMDYIVISIDSTFSKSNNSDFVVIGAIGVKGANKFVLHVERARMSFNESLSKLISVIKKYPTASELIIEKKANGDAIIDELKLIPQIQIPIYAYSPTTSKEARAQSVSPSIEYGELYVPDPKWEGHWDIDWVESFITELTEFPSGKHDDQVDMLTQALIRIKTSAALWLEQLAVEEKPKDTDDREERIKKIFGFDDYSNSGGGMGLGF